MIKDFGIFFKLRNIILMFMKFGIEQLG